MGIWFHLKVEGIDEDAALEILGTLEHELRVVYNLRAEEAYVKEDVE